MSDTCGLAAANNPMVACSRSASTDRALQLDRRGCAHLDNHGAPIVTTTDASSDPIVWAVGAECDDQLHGFAGCTTL
jgi:hypothetical protein